MRCILVFDVWVRGLGGWRLVFVIRGGGVGFDGRLGMLLVFCRFYYYYRVF